MNNSIFDIYFSIHLNSKDKSIFDFDFISIPFVFAPLLSNYGI